MGTTVPDDYPLQIKAIRAKLSLTQVALANELGVSFPSVNRWENGKARPSKVYWGKLLELVGGNDSTTNPEPENTPPKSISMDFTADADAVRALVEGERLSFGHLANPSFATEIASIDPLPHQRIAVYDHMLKSPRLRFLLADDAGAGKTIMTGLYIREMLSRRLLRRILIVPPAGLVGNWHQEMWTLFNLQFKIISGNDCKEDNPFDGNDSNLVIVSVDTLSGTRAFSRMQDSKTQPYDLVVFDEAHKLSCNRDKNFRVDKTARYRLAEAMAGIISGSEEWKLLWKAHHLLLLTATPHMGKDYPYYALWRLLEPDVFSTLEAFENFPPDQRVAYFIRRTKEEMVKITGEPLYPKRSSDTLGYELTQGEVSEQKLYDETTDYLRYVYNKAMLLNQSAAQLAMSVFQRRLASSTYALMCSFERRVEKINKIIEDVQNGEISMEQLLLAQKKIRDDDDILDSRSADEESSENGKEGNEIAEDKLLQGIIAASIDDLLTEKEQALKLLELSRQVYEMGHESKFDRLCEIISDPQYQNEKLIVFTEHRDTLDFIVRRLGGMGFTGQIATIHGGMHYSERHNQVERFRAPIETGGARFMICTDAAAEGINLQFCWIMINYDVPWNPARLEQRMGRIHRYGQAHDPVIILNLVAPNTREGRVIKTLLDKLEKIRKQLRSDKVYDCIGRIFMDVSIKAYMQQACLGDSSQIASKLDGQLTKEQVQAIANREKVLYGDGGDVKRELPRIKEGLDREVYFKLLPGYVRRYLDAIAPRIGFKIDGDLGETFNLEPRQKKAADPLMTILDNYPASIRGIFSVVRPKDAKSCIWMHPGEPIFERIRTMAYTKMMDQALRGAVFMDPTSDHPYLFHLARVSVVRKSDPDIPELSKEDVLECRLVGVRQTEGAEMDICPVEHLLLLRGCRGLPASGQRLAVVADRQKDSARAFLFERSSRAMAVEKRTKLLSSMPERERFITQGFNYEEAELATARAKLTPKAREGNRAAAQHLSEIKTRQRALAARRDQSLTILRREPELIVPGEIEFIAHALVVPSDSKADREQMEVDVEMEAMAITKAHEEAESAHVRYVHTAPLARAAGLPDHPGFDILSAYPDGARKCIEVKGRANTGDIEITDNEWARACNLRDEYWLYVVYDCATPSPRLLKIQDPFGRLIAKNKGGVLISQSAVLEAANS